MKTAEELLKALTEYQKNCISGGILPRPDGIDMNTVVAQYADDAPPETFGIDLNVVMAYNSFRDGINEYQRANNISGITNETRTIFGKSITYPYFNNQLVLIDGDREKLKPSVSRVTEFFLKLVKDHDLVLTLALDVEEPYQSCITDRVIIEAERAASVMVSCQSLVRKDERSWEFTGKTENPCSVNLSLYGDANWESGENVYFEAFNPKTEYGQHIIENCIDQWS